MNGTAAILTRLVLLTFGWAATLPAARGVDAGEWEAMRGLEPRGYCCGRLAQAPRIDGVLDDEAWRDVPWTESFHDIRGPDRPAPRHRTRVKMAWDDSALYVAAEIDEPHVWATIHDHDAVIFKDDDFEVFLDPDGDNHDYRELEINALGTTWDLSLDKPYKDGGRADDGWECPGLETAVHVDGTLNDPRDVDRGWSVEIKIPWADWMSGGGPAGPPAPGTRWRINCSRVDWPVEVVEGRYRKRAGEPEDNWVWSPQGIVDMHRPERWGTVQFSGGPPGRDASAADPEAVPRDLLMEVYHRQKAFHAREGRWTNHFSDLGFDPGTHAAGNRMSLRLVPGGFEATVEPAEPGALAPRWRTRQDSRLWDASSGKPLVAALERAADRAQVWLAAIRRAPFEQREAVEFLIAHMPDRDLHGLEADYVLDNVALAHRAWDECRWGSRIPRDIFHNDILPYASISESRDDWRREFSARFRPLVAGVDSPGLAAARLNAGIFKDLGVRYSKKRRRADQGPRESIATGLASCSGLSVLLIDACRALGIPARFVGTPMWANGSGNHSWVEIWDGDWHFTGAAEPDGDRLDRGWFVGNASAARADDPLHAIYATSFRRTGLSFPLSWNPEDDSIPAVDVTARYVAGNARRAAGGGQAPETEPAAVPRPWSVLLARDAGPRPPWDELEWSDHALDRDAAEAAARDLWADHVRRMRRDRAAEVKDRLLVIGDGKMPFFYSVSGQKPAAGRSLWISLHGGGGAPAAVNTRQWENQKRLYTVPEGVYLAPRAPTDTWDLWHRNGIDAFYDRLIEDMIVFEEVDPDRVYLLGYSAGGDGVYQVAPRMADRWAAAAMMAGHPNETSPLGLRNLPFALQVGAQDASHNRNRVAARWEGELGELRRQDPAGYEHWVRIRAGKGHWMDREDAEAIPWMAKFTRNPWPDRLVWKQDDVVRDRFYWLAVDPAQVQPRAEIRATRDGQRIVVESTDARQVTLLLRDEFIDLDEPVVVTSRGRTVFEGVVKRTFRALAESLAARGDPRLMFCGRVTVTLPAE